MTRGIFKMAFVAVLLVILVGGARLAEAGVVRVEVIERTPFAEGHRFEHSGAYERLKGRIHIEVDPGDPANAQIHDLKRAPRNARGQVECWTDFFLLKPVDPRRGNGRILYDVSNRGNKLAIETFNGARSNNPTTLADAGNGFLMRRGYSVLWTGWNGDVLADGTDRLLAGLPIAQRDGRPVTGQAHAEICTKEKVHSRAFFWSPWGISDAYPSVSLDNSTATLTMRARRSDAGVEVPREAWAFGRWENGQLVPDPTHLYVKDGFRPGWLYDLVYTAQAPRVTGLGLAALRDSLSFFRYAERDAAGFANPLAESIERAYIFGISQSGRLVRHFIYAGFNADEAGRIIFDGALAHVPGSGKGMFNHRFRMTTCYGTYHQGNLSGSESFPLAPASQTDPVSGRQGDTLARARAQGCVPKMIFTQTSTEYWSRAASLLHTDVEGKKDTTLPDNVRVYLVSSAQHLGGGPHTRGNCQQPRNVLDDRTPILRAMLVALDRWVSGLGDPPASRYPRLADGTLVDLDTWQRLFPKIPGVGLPGDYYRPRRLDFGPRFGSEGIADIVPPKMGQAFGTLIPAVDADGNDRAGIRLPDVAVPLGTYTGWNLRTAASGPEGILTRLDGTYLPFATTRQQRREQNDPRPSVRERYSTRQVYLAQMTAAALELHREGFLLAEDVATILTTASERDFWND
jgi:Alpha/beta hydrolase domain